MIQNSISVIIPTLGGKSLIRIINLINDGDEIPGEILVCLPEKSNYDSRLNDILNVRIIKTPFKGQVAQRVEGFKQAKFEFVLQLDDDCKIQNEDIKNLLIVLKSLGPGNSVAPIYFDENTLECSHGLTLGFKGFIKNMIATIICGSQWGIKRMGTVSAVGTNYGVDINYMKSENYQSEWLPGGCVLHYNQSTIKSNFFPFEGKAFCEDLMHSYLLRKNNIKLWVTKNASCKTKHAYFPNKKDEVIQYLKAFKYFYYLRNKKILRFWIWYFLNLLRQWIQFNTEKVKIDKLNIGIEINRISYTPEAYAYANFLKQKGFNIDINYREKLSNDNSIVLHFMGFRPFWFNFLKKKNLEIHEYTSLSTAPLARIKDKFKYLFNIKPAGRIFMNNDIKSSFGFNDNVPFIIRPMGADLDMFTKKTYEKEFDLIYCGSILKRAGLTQVIEKIAKIGLTIIIVGFYDDETLDRFSKFSNIKMVGRVERKKLPELLFKSKVGLNYTPDIKPLSLQSSTKTIEYCAAGLGVISSKYEWMINFEKERSAKFMWINDLKNKSDFENFKFVTPNVSDLEWNTILKNCSFDKFINKINILD